MLEILAYSDNMYATSSWLILKDTQKEWGQWTVYFTSPQSFIIMFSYSLAKKLWEL